MVKNVKKNEKILVYHSIWITVPILIAQKIKKFKIILEVEEIYQDVMTLHPFFDKWENKMLHNADAYLFSTDILPHKLKIKKPYCVIYGSYSVEEKINTPSNDNKIHVVYAGIIDQEKKGAFNALASAQYLPENFVLHIIGFGDTKTLLPLIKKQNETTLCKTYFHGKKMGSEYVSFCQGCHIGLSTQKMDGAYLQSSFPSKILSYLGMGLNVVSCSIKCVELSKISTFVTYYHEDNYEKIANAIIECSKNLQQDSRTYITKLHNDFKSEVNELLT